jgi:hypothetical protein
MVVLAKGEGQIRAGTYLEDVPAASSSSRSALFLFEDWNLFVIGAA